MDKLSEIITSEIRDRGAIRFARFMELALYCPVYGYYEKEGDNVGRRGDFYTSVSVGPLFGELLAAEFAAWFETGGVPKTGGSSALPEALELIEAGAHRGALARDILSWLSGHKPVLYDALHYRIIEPSPRRQSWQQETLRNFGTRVEWARDWHEIQQPNSAGQETRFRIIFANELLDALPIHRICWDKQSHSWCEWGVTLEGNCFKWIQLPLEDSDLARAVHEVLELAISPGAGRSVAEFTQVLPDGFTFELSPETEDWWRQAAERLGIGWLLTFDYGLALEELFSPERAAGTLRAYRAHQVSGNVLKQPGYRDITAHVNFARLRQIGERCGLTTERLTKQGTFLTELAAKSQDTPAFWTPERIRQFQTLTHPDHLGRAFRVLIQSRGV